MNGIFLPKCNSPIKFLDNIPTKGSFSKPIYQLSNRETVLIWLSIGDILQIETLADVGIIVWCHVLLGWI